MIPCVVPSHPRHPRIALVWRILHSAIFATVLECACHVRGFQEDWDQNMTDWTPTIGVCRHRALAKIIPCVPMRVTCVSRICARILVRRQVRKHVGRENSVSTFHRMNQITCWTRVYLANLGSPVVRNRQLRRQLQRQRRRQLQRRLRHRRRHRLQCPVKWTRTALCATFPVSNSNVFRPSVCQWYCRMVLRAPTAWCAMAMRRARTVSVYRGQQCSVRRGSSVSKRRAGVLPLLRRHRRRLRHRLRRPRRRHWLRRQCSYRWGCSHWPLCCWCVDRTIMSRHRLTGTTTTHMWLLPPPRLLAPRWKTVEREGDAMRAACSLLDIKAE